MGFKAAKPGVYVVSLLVMALAVGGGWWAAALRPDTRPALTSALDVLPASTTVVGFTHWEGIREHLDLGVVDTSKERAELANSAKSRDLTTRSVIGRDLQGMHDLVGWSPADFEWEVFGQDRVGSADVARLDGSVSFADTRAKLKAAGYREDGPIWSAPDRAGIPVVLAHVALVPRQRLVVMSDQRRPIPDVLDVIAGRSQSLAGSQAAADTAEALAGSDSVILQAGRLACGTTAVARDADLERQERTAVERAGSLESYRFSGRGLLERGGSGFSAQRLVFAMTFESAAVASEQARVRARLSTGPFIGRSGSIDDTLRLRSSGVDESTVRLAFAHDPDTDVFMTGTGPALFASC